MSNDLFEDDIAAINRTTQDVLEKSDRVRAVLLGSQIDRLLQRLLDAYLVPKKGKRDRLLDGSGFADTFSARVELAFRIGLISEEWYMDLQNINQIRDAFAHGLTGLTLNDPNLQKLCYSLKTGTAWIEHAPVDVQEKDNPQTRFVGCAVVLSASLCIARKKLEKIPEVWQTFNPDAVKVGK